MPTVLRQDGFDLILYPDDHLPMHVHVFRGGTEAVINFGAQGALPAVREIRGMSRREVRDALALVTRHQGRLIRRWREIHG